MSLISILISLNRITDRTHRYQARLAARPLLTQSITTAILFATGDLTAQQLVEKRGLEKHEWARTGRMALYGGSEFDALLLQGKPSG